jgi:hypothetical protein
MRTPNSTLLIHLQKCGDDTPTGYRQYTRTGLKLIAATNKYLPIRWVNCCID